MKNRSFNKLSVSWLRTKKFWLLLYLLASTDKVEKVTKNLAKLRKDLQTTEVDVKEKEEVGSLRGNLFVIFTECYLLIAESRKG